MSYGYGRGYRQQSGGGFGLGPRLIPIVIGLIAIGFTMVRGCQHGPFGRHQIVAMSVDQEAQLGMQAYQEVLSQSRVIRKGAAVESVRRVADRLIAATRSPEFQRRVGTRIPDFQWELEVVEDSQVNAFCLPGGKIVVYTGILPVAETDAGLATVIGHEISHALAHHGAERMAKQQMAQIGLAAAGASMGDLDQASRRQVMMVLNAGAQFGILKYSRDHETEADHMGLLLMAIGGYDPRESIDFWQRMSSQGGGGTPEFLSTHPSHGTRVKDLQRWMPEAITLYQHAEPALQPEADLNDVPLINDRSQKGAAGPRRR